MNTPVSTLHLSSTNFKAPTQRQEGSHRFVCALDPSLGALQEERFDACFFYVFRFGERKQGSVRLDSGFI